MLHYIKPIEQVNSFLNNNTHTTIHDVNIRRDYCWTVRARGTFYASPLMYNDPAIVSCEMMLVLIVTNSNSNDETSVGKLVVDSKQH